MSDSWIFPLSSHPSIMHHSSLSNSTAVVSPPAPLTCPSSFQGHGNHPLTKVASNHLTDPQEGSPHLPHLQVTSPHLHPPQVTSPLLVSQPQVSSPNFHHGQVTPSHLAHCQVTSPHIPHSQVTSPLLSSHQFTNPHLFQQPQVTSHHYVPQSQISPSYHLTHSQTTSPLSYPHVTSPHFVQQPQVTSPHIVTQPQMTSPHQNHFSSPNHNPGLDNSNWSQSETSSELSCLLNSYTYSYQIESTANLDVNLQNQSQINTSVTHQLENTHRLAYNTNTFTDGGLYGQGGTPGPVENTWEALEPALSELQCSPLNSMSEGATLGKWSSIDFSSSSTEDFSNSQFFPESYHDNNASQSFCSPTTPGPSPHYPQTPTISSPGPQMHPRKERMSFSTQASTQLNINKPPICCLHESNSYPVTPDPGQQYPNETSTCLLPSQSEPMQEQRCFSPQGKGQDVSSAAQPSSVPAGLNWKEESGSRGRRRGGGRGGGDPKPDWTRMKPPPQENASGALSSRLQCMVCKRDFRSLPALNGHMRSHSGVRASACIKKGEDASSHILPSASLVMPVSVPVQSRGASKSCRTGRGRCSRLPPATGGAVLYRSLMHLKEEEAVTSGNKVAGPNDGEACGDDGARCHYTPPPMLCPLRPGTGLYCSLISLKGQQRVQLHNTHNGLNEPVAIETLTTGINKPCINIGRGFQAQIPPLRDHKRVYSDSHNALLLWTPWDELEHAVNQKRVEAVLRMTGSSVMPGGGASPEYALHVLSESRGDFLRTVEKLLSTPETSISHAGWSPAERRLLVKSLQLHHKDFSRIQKAVQTKSLSQCVEFYYLWKKKLSLSAKTPTGLTITLPNTNGQSSSQSHGAS
ncbi:Transcriptional-regulating factor 1 [Channa argus]|uniref:Transcriptional-regulating factor 1 n=1 Tax=Channa argus TaxID=215402 RepID=A0A6G1PDN4_CHAAH|nr:Transcriptional-regulating factor 1 [Channa argus]